MDYLDPRKRRAYNTRLVVGYVLIAVVIGLATYIINAGANGYGFNVKTGQIVQNGLVFVDSNPGGSEIYLNGQDRSKQTPARLVLPIGSYTLSIKKNGYRDWTRKFTLSEPSVARFVYPFLFPVKPVTASLKTYQTQPGLMTESPDRHWLLVESNEASTQSPVFDEYDTGTLDQTTPSVQQITLPAAVLTNFSADSQLTEVEWSTDNDHLLLKHSYSGGSEFIVFSRAHPDQSFNVNKMFNMAPAQVSLFNKQAGQLYIYDQTGGSLYLGDTGTTQLGQPIIKNVLAYKTYGRDLITYITDNGEPAGKVAVRILSAGKTYKLNEFSAGSTYLIDFAQFQSNFYYAAGSDTADRINIYENPLDGLQDPASAKALPLLALDITGAQKLGFSDNTRFIGAESGQNFSVYDFEAASGYQYTITPVLADSLSWMDGHRYIGDSAGKVFVMDYDGANQQLLTPTSEPFGALFSRDYKHMLTIAPAADGSSFSLQDVDMRAGVDLPKK